jgi:hypothetical protein
MSGLPGIGSVSSRPREMAFLLRVSNPVETFNRRKADDAYESRRK